MTGFRTTLARLLSGQKVPHKRLVLVAGLAASIGILAYLVGHSLGPVAEVSGHIIWPWFMAAVACTIGSYLMIGLALGAVLSVLGFGLSFAEIMGIALVSTTANYFVSTAGVSGFALKAHLLRKRHVPYGITLTASVVSSAILYIVLAVIIGQGLVYLFVHLQGTTIAIMESALGLLILVAITVPLLMFFFNHELRGKMTRRLFHFANRGVFMVSKAEIPREDFEEFEEQLTDGLERIRQSKAGLARTIGYTAMDWMLCMATLYCAFRAVGVHVSVGDLSAGFTAGQAAALIPVLPGGLGLVEGSMATIFEGLGVAWEKALVAVLLYRFAYYALPGIVSVVVLWGLKVSEPTLIEETVRETLPEELRLQARKLERDQERRNRPR
jgi:glycosyltransferase 2 family protein